MIVLNEKEYAEKYLENKTLLQKPLFTLNILAKYYYHHLGYRKKKIVALLTDCIKKYYPKYEYNKSGFDESIEKIAKNAGNHILHEISGVWITKSELSTISKIQNKVLERLAFTMLCLAKLNNIKNPKNNGWVNTDSKELFALARISCSVDERFIKICMLKDLSLLELPKRNDNLNSRVTFVNDNSHKALFVSDFRELGYEYLMYRGEDFIRCDKCGILTRNNIRKNKKYCSNCASYTPQKIKTITCIDCGKEFVVVSKDSHSQRCKACYRIHRREKVNNNVHKYREKNACNQMNF